MDAVHVSLAARVFVFVNFLLVLICPWSSVHCGRVWPVSTLTTRDHAFVRLLNPPREYAGGGVNSFQLTESSLSSARCGVEKALKFLLETIRGARSRPPSATPPAHHHHHQELNSKEDRIAIVDIAEHDGFNVPTAAHHVLASRFSQFAESASLHGSGHSNVQNAESEPSGMSTTSTVHIELEEMIATRSGTRRSATPSKGHMNSVSSSTVVGELMHTTRTVAPDGQLITSTSCTRREINAAVVQSSRHSSSRPIATSSVVTRTSEAAAVKFDLGTLSKGGRSSQSATSESGSGSGSFYTSCRRLQNSLTVATASRNLYTGVAGAPGRSKFVFNRLAKGTTGPESGIPSPDHNSIPVKAEGGGWH